ncbi:MAG: MBL fold metallo-hydrolase [Deltaproteobacteria bacterium]|nr:MBL fold metallo-hydrolase [Deltaproteobacteria bacterium]MBW1952440.1 MBL fold metallo-hydrolase [Deltaproteobacteria bacterium]MBW1986684.1 MBL fold metallo-hydrolase [Deltaproteobacteria bacterium]MBW2134891.1 MBL fold metallo-hydrolase [Deltaproteobacteria bacterium]
MEIRFWGTRGSIAAPGSLTVEYGGNTTCVEVVLGSGERIIIDAGSGIRALGDHLLKSEQPITLFLLITHSHWDHILGFPFFAPIYNRHTKIWVDGCPRGFWGLEAVFDSHQANGFFPVAFNELKAQIQPLGIITHRPLEIGDAVIEGIELNHPQGGMGFRFRGKDHTFVFLTDNELDPQAPPGKQLRDYAHFAQGCDLLVHDAQYTPEEIAARRGWGHSTYKEAVELALAAGARRLRLFHHDPARTDAQIKEIVSQARQLLASHSGNLEIDAAREGEVILL